MTHHFDVEFNGCMINAQYGLPILRFIILYFFSILLLSYLSAVDGILKEFE